MLKIKTENGHTCFIEDEDLKFYPNSDILEEDVAIEDAKAPEVEETEDE